MAKRVRWTGNASDLPKDTSERHVRYVGMGSGGNTYQPYAKTENNSARTVTVEDTARGSKTQKEARVVGSPGGTFLGGFSYKGKSRREKTEAEIAQEQEQAAAGYREYKRLATMDLNAQEAAVAAAKEKAAQSREKYNIHAFGAYDSTPTKDESNYSKLLADLNKAKSIQYDIKGRKELDALTAEQADALDRLSKASRPQTSAMATNQASEAAALKAKSELEASGLSDEKIRELLGYHRNIPKREKNAETFEDIQGAAEAYAETNPALATVASVGTNLASGVGAIGVAFEHMLDPDTPVDYHGGAFLPYAYTSGVRDTVSKNLETDHGKAASFAYGVGTSMLDSAATVGLTVAGVPAWLATSTLGGAAATSAMQEAKDRGLDDDRAIWTGLLAGVAESAFEKISLENLITMKAPTGTVRQKILGTLRNTAKQAGIEGSEEVFTDFANLISDGIINGNMSQIRQAMDGYVAEGMTEEEARDKAIGDWIKDTAVDFAAGALAGGLMGGASNAVSKISQNAEAGREYAGREQELLDESKELNPDNDLAKKYQERLDNGKKLSGRQLMRLIEQNETDAVTSDKAKIQSAAEGRLTQLGETGDTAQIAQAITKQVAGEQLSTAEQSLIDGSRYGRRVANEIDPENVKAVATKDGIVPRDTFASEWTGKLDTKRIYPEVFNRLMPQAQKTGETTARQEGEVTGAKYNAETGKLDAIVTNEAGEVKTVPAAEAEMTPMQEELFDWANELKLEAAGPLMVRAYQPEQNMELYTRSFKLAYEYGKAGMPMDYVEKSEGVNYLHPTQIKLAYEEGQAATQRKVQAREEKIRSGGTADTTARKKGSVSLQGAKVGGKTYAPVNRKTVDSRQWASVKAMRAFSRAVGVDVVFYQSQANERGVYEGANGFYKDGKLYLDINAGRDTTSMTETAILKTAAHELTHFIQANSAQYEALKSFVVNKLTQEEGVNFEDLVADKQRREPGLDYDEAVDEVVADACEMMLKDSTAVEQLAKENRSLAEKIRDWLREWVENLKIALEGLQADRTESRAMMQYAQELQEIWDNALMDAARNNRGAAREAAPAESRQQARIGTSESIKPGEKPLKGMRDDDKMGAVNASLKEDLENGKARKEDRGAFLRRAVEEGYQVFEGKSAAYGYRSVRWEYARENARQIQKELTELGIDAEIVDGDILWNLDGISSARRVPQATAVEKERILINTAASLAPRNIAGHEAFHLWYGLSARKAFEDVVTDNLIFSSKEFLGYQAVISEAYLGDEANLSDEAQYTKLTEEIIAYISGDIYEGVNDDLLRPMFRDYDAVKAAWVKLCKDNSGGEVRFQQRDSDTSGIKDQIKSHAQELSNKPVVANVQVENLDKMSIKEKRRWAENVLKSTGYKVDRQGFGTIAYEPRHINEGLNYLKQSGEIAAFAALPQVLKRGEIIERHDNHKGRNFGTVTIAAPVMINGVRGNMAAVVQMTGKNHYHTHRILMPDGAVFEFRQKNSTDSKPAGATPKTGAHATPMDSVHNSSIRSLATNSQEKSSEKVQNQQRDPRLSDRDVLSLAADMALRQQNKSWTPEDRTQLELFKGRMRQLEYAQATLTALKEEQTELLAGRKVAELSKDEQFELAQNRNRTDLAKKNVKKWEESLWKLESQAAIKTLLRKSRITVEKETAFKARKRYREKTEERQRYQVLKKRLERTTNEWKRMLLKPTKDRYAPEELVRSCLEVALMLDESGPREGTKSRYRYETTSEALAYMKKQYDALKNSEDQFYRLGYDKELSELVEQLKNALDGKAIRDLTYEEAGDVAQVLTSMQGILKDARYQIGSLERISTQELVDGAVRQMLRMPERTKVEAATDAVARQSASVMRNIRRMCQYDDNAPLYKLFRQLEEGVKKKDRFIMEANKMFDRFAGDRMLKSATVLKTYRIGDVNVLMTEMEAMQLILSAKRELSDKTRHLEGKGFIVPDLELMRKGKGQDAISKGQEVSNVFLRDILQLENGLDDWAKDYMHTASEFFNGLARNAINEATVQTKHRRIAMTKDYVPNEVDKRTVVKDIDGVKFDATIEGDGMLKSVVAGAQNPLIIRGLNTIVENHIERVGRIYGLAVPIRNFNKAYNAKSQKGQGMSMKEAIARAWPAADTKLIEQAITDLQTSRERSTSDLSKLMRKAEGKFVEATLLSNISVTIKQAASYSTAGLYLSQKALFPYQTTIARLFAADNSAFAKKLFAEIDEHTPMHYMRRKGMSMEEAATVAKDNSKVVRWMDKKLPDVANPLKWIQNMDVATTAAIWLATKRQVELDGVKQSDPTYWSRVTELYEKVISETQPMYDSLHRPEVQKNTDEVVRGLMMFRTQPLQNAGILYDAAGEMAQAKKSGNQEQIKASTRKFKMAVGSQVASLAVFATMTLLAYAVRNRLGRYRDDEEEVTVASVMKRVLGDMAVNGAQLIAPIGGGVVAGGIEKAITGSSYGGTLSIPTLDAINDWVSQMDRVRQDIVKLSEDEEADIVTDSVDFAMDTAGVLGIPAKNAFGILRGIVGNITDLTGHELSWATDKPDPSMAIVKACFENGHMEKGREVIDQVIQSKMDAGKEEKEARSAVRSSLTAYYKKLYLRAYKKKNEKEMKRIRMVIQGSRMYDDNASDVAAGWVKKWAEEEKKKEKAKKK